MPLISAVRRAAKVALLPLGAATRRREGDVQILLYHRIVPEGREIDIAPDVFDRHMSTLASSEVVASLDDALEGDGGGVVVTFDDGSPDLLENALPRLLEHGVPAVLYLATGLVADRGATPAGARLSWRDLEDAVASGVITVGAHTHTHPDLSQASETFAYEEMRRSKELIEDRLGTACRHFAYPFAVASPAADRAARQLFESAALGAWRTNRAGRIDPYRLGRTPVLRSDGTSLFRAKLRGWLDPEGLLYRVARRGPWRPSGSFPA